MAAKDYELSRAICEGIYGFDKDLIVLALSGGELARAAKDMGMRVAQEVFADRAYCLLYTSRIGFETIRALLK